MKKLYSCGYNQGGIRRYNFNEDKLTLEFSFVDVKNPSFLEIHPKGKTLYCVNEQESKAEFTSFNIKNNCLEKINSVSTKGADLCHLCLSPRANAVYGACYGSGNIIGFKINEDGSIGSELFNIFHSGSSVHERQDASRIHQVIIDPAGKRLIAVDFGTDKIYTYNLKDNGAVDQESLKETAIEKGQGPRHLVFNGADKAYLLTELGNAIISLRYNKYTGEFTTLDKAQLTKDKNSFGGEIALCENRLYASVRGVDQIYMFDASSCIKLIGVFKSGGSYPRMFSVDKNYIYCGNQNSNEIQVISLGEDGMAKSYEVKTPLESVAFCKMWG